MTSAFSRGLRSSAQDRSAPSRARSAAGMFPSFNLPHMVVIASVHCPDWTRSTKRSSRQSPFLANSYGGKDQSVWDRAK